MSIFALLLWTLAFASAEEGVHREISSTIKSDPKGEWSLIETRVQAGAHAINQFTYHRLAPLRTRARGAPILLLPGGGTNFEIYLIGGEDSVAIRLLREGHEIWGYSPRTRGLKGDACSRGASCSEMRHWGIKTYLWDIQYVVSRIRSAGWGAPVVGGLSLGAALAFAAVNENPDLFSAAFFLEGALHSTDPTVPGAMRSLCRMSKVAIAAGTYRIDDYVRLKADARLARTAPDLRSDRDPALTNRAHFLKTITTPQDPPNAPVPGYTLARGNETELLFSDLEVAFELVEGMNDHEPLAVMRDFVCGMGGDRTFTSNLARFSAPALGIGAGHGFGKYSLESLALLGSSQKTWALEPEFGHADFIGSRMGRAKFVNSVTAWLSGIDQR